MFCLDGLTEIGRKKLVLKFSFFHSNIPLRPFFHLPPPLLKGWRGVRRRGPLDPRPLRVQPPARRAL